MLESSFGCSRSRRVRSLDNSPQTDASRSVNATLYIVVQQPLTLRSQPARLFDVRAAFANRRGLPINITASSANHMLLWHLAVAPGYSHSPGVPRPPSSDTVFGILQLALKK